MSLLGRVFRHFTPLPPPPPPTVPACLPAPACHRCSQREQESNSLRCEVGYWKAMHAKAVEREKLQQKKIEELEAKLKLREHQLFGRKSEHKANSPAGTAPPSTTPKRKRGHVKGTPGHAQRHFDHLPVKDEPIDLPQDQKHCPFCQLPYQPSGTEDSEILEIEVQAYRRRIRRKRYLRTCQCSPGPHLITAPVAPRLLPRSRLGLSVWTLVLVDKFLYQRPTYRLLTSLEQLYGLSIPQGTLTDGLQRLAPLFEPLYDAIHARQLTESRWHADQTRWAVFAEYPDKDGHRWYLWVFLSQTTTVFRLEPTRSALVPQTHFGHEATGILNVDRYVAYKVMARDGRILLAFCWSHVRRDFLDVSRDWPRLEAWGLAWVDRIGQLYQLNRERKAVLSDPEAFAQAQARLVAAIDQMKGQRDQELDQPNLHPAAHKALTSLKVHWSGLVVFVDHPEVDMDNNEAERALRNEAVGRKCYYGSGSLWSARLAVLLFTLFQTLLKWDINPRLFLNTYLLACARAGGKVPTHAQDFLPWNLSKQALAALKLSEGNRPVCPPDTPSTLIPAAVEMDTS
jgi:transposase